MSGPLLPRVFSTVLRVSADLPVIAVWTTHLALRAAPISARRRSRVALTGTACRVERRVRGTMDTDPCALACVTAWWALTLGRGRVAIEAAALVVLSTLMPELPAPSGLCLAGADQTKNARRCRRSQELHSSSARNWPSKLPS